MKKWKNKISIVILVALCCMMISSCGQQNGKTDNFKTDYKTSEIYSRQDMDNAIKIIKEAFKGWKGCELHQIRYVGDECNNDEKIKWMNDLSDTNDLEPKFSQCIQFECDFHSPIKESDMDAFNPDEEYTDWSWWLARTEDGEWHLMTWGY